MNISVIGYRGTGKSSLAPCLAQRLGWDWTDLDSEIERQAGCSIRQIFAEGGESRFRQLEKDALARQLGRSNIVLATGGGVILDKQSREWLKAAGPVIWLTASVDVILDRLNLDPTTSDRRPALTQRLPREEISELLDFREPLYRECATIQLATDTADVETLVEQTLQQLDVPRT